MMKWFAACVILVFGRVVCLADSAPSPDYGFEQVAKDGKSLVQWRSNSSQPTQSMEAVGGTQFVRSGQHSVKLVQEQAGKVGHFYSQIAQPVKSGEEYILSFWVRGKGTAQALAYLYHTDDKGNEAFDSTAALPPVKAGATAAVADDGQWHQHQYKLKFDNPRVKSARFVIAVSGTVYVDDAQFISASAAASEAKSAGESAVRPNLITVGAGKAAPRVDGTIGEDEYSVRGGGMLNNATQDLYRLPNAYYLSRDKDRIYFALSLKLPDGYKVMPHSGRRDDPGLVASKDVLYLFFRPDHNVAAKGFEGAYLAIAADGSIYDAWEKVDWQNASCVRDSSFNAVWQVQSKVQNGVWTVELSAPMKELHLPADGKQSSFLLSFGANLQKSAVVWQVHSNWFDHYQAFGEIHLSDDGVIAQMPTAGNLSRGQLQPDFLLHNSGDAAVPYELTYLVSTPRMVGGGIGGYVFDQALDQRNKDIVRDQIVYQWTPTGTIPPGQEVKQTAEAKLPRVGHYVLEMEARAGGRAVAYQKIPFHYAPPIVAQMIPVPSKELIKTTVSLAGAAPEERGKLRIVFQDKQGKTVLEQDLPADREEIDTPISMAKLPPGDYDVHFILATASGNEVANEVVPFKKWDTPPWLKERAGLDALQPNWVPKPWTRIQTADGRVSVWGRDFVLQPGSLLTNITSQGKDLMVAGAVIKYLRDDKEQTISISGPHQDSINDGRVVLSQTGESPDFTVKLTHTIEFDGMDRIDLTLTPKTENLKIEKLWLELPFHNMPYTASTSLDGHSWQHGKVDNAFFDKPQTYRWIWLGDDEVGCAFFVDNYKGWIINSTKPRLTLHTRGEACTLELRFINEPSSVAGPLAITFGLQPSPFKPRFEGWRGIRPQGLGMTPPPTNLVMPSASIWNSCDSKPSPRSWSVLDEMLEYLHGRGQRAYPYMGAFFISPYDDISREFPFDKSQQPVPAEYLLKSKQTATRQEDYFYYAEDWLGTPRSINEASWETRQEARVSPSSSYTDYFVYGIEQMLKRSKLDGLYLDIQQPMISYDPDKGHVVMTKDGVREGTAELFATRDFYKRLYRVFEQNRGENSHPWFMGHGFAANAPFSSLWDMNFNGEEVKPNAPFQATALNIQKDLHGDPLAILDPAQKDPDYNAYAFRAIFGQQFGLPSMYLPQYGYLPELKLPQHSREMLSLTFMHNNLLWPAYIPAEPVYEFWSKVEVPFGMADTEFFPYWTNGIQTSAPFIKASYWKKSKSEDYLLALSNWSDRPVQAKITLPKPLSTAKQCIEMESGTTIPMNLELTISIPAHDLRVLRLK